MSKVNTNPPVNLLSRLKLSYSVISNNKKIEFGKKSSQNGNTKVGISANVFSKIPQQTPNISPTIENGTITKVNKPKPTINNTIKNNTVFTSNKIQRPFSTYGRFLSTPSGCESQKFIVDICQGILSSKIKNIVIMAGAGISCPSGIPDFRSPKTGLYDNLKQYKIPYPEAIFDIDYFSANPKPFYTIAKEIFPSGKYRPNKVHYFFRLLQNKKLLRRIYTQNIDGLERLAGINDGNLIEAHGTFATASCTRCRESYSAIQIKESIDKNEICICSKCRGVIKPNIVFYGEDLPPKFQLYRTDFQQADLLFVMGTSLEVEPFASIVDSTRFNTPRILINMEAVGVFRTKRRVNDNCLLGDVIEGIDTIIKTLNWETEFNEVIKIGEEQKINFLDTIPKLGNKPRTNTRNFSTLSNNRKPRVSLLPPITKTHFGKSEDSSSGTNSSSDRIDSEESSSSLHSDSSN